MKIALFLVILFSSAALYGRTREPNLEKGQEAMPTTEAADTATIRDFILRSLAAAHSKNPNNIVQRDAHPKAHGCVKAEFTVLNNGPQYAYGLFAHPTVVPYKAWIRFSNGSQGDNPDSKPDGRGMAIKVLGVQGEKILSDEKSTQDFLMINNDSFFVRNAHDYIDFLKNSFWFLALRPFHEGRIALQTASKPITNPFQSQYWSMTPYRLGPESLSQAVKYTAKPISCNGEKVEPTPKSESRDFLREAMISSMTSGNVCFEFNVQLQTDAVRTPIEDPTISWDEAGARFQTVARIRIKKLDNDGWLGTQNIERTNFCENLSLNPWHSLIEHRPLGGINRVRRIVYESVSAYRHLTNGAVQTEPSGSENF